LRSDSQPAVPPLFTPPRQPKPPARAGKDRYFNVPFAEYLQWEAVNWHTLEPGRRSALQMKHEMLLPSDASDSMVKGGALDCMIFDGAARFDSLYAAMPRFDGHPNSKAYKDAKSAWADDHAKAILLTPDQMGEVQGMYDALRRHPVAWPLLNSGKGRAQLSLVWRDDRTKLLCKGRIDRLAQIEARIIDPNAAPGQMVLALIDLKSTRNPGVGPNEFPQEAARYGYHGQQAYYLDGCRTLEPAEMLPLIVAVENAPPFDVVVHRLDAEDKDGVSVLEHGRRLYRRLLDTYAQGKRTGTWPGCCSVVNPLSLPSWAQETEDAA
jgi:hypothetical protein